MEVVVPTKDFNFESASTSPYVSTPSSPKVFGRYYISAPTSPTRASILYSHFSSIASTSPAIPFESHNENHKGDGCRWDEKFEDFAFSGHHLLEAEDVFTASADELFEAGKIRPLKPPPCLQVPFNDLRKNVTTPSPKSPKSPASRFFNRRQKDDDFDPFEKAIEITRGRARSIRVPSDGSQNQRMSRSLSPLKGLFQSGTKTTVGNAKTSSDGYAKGKSKKWKLKHLFFFRSASEGRVTGNNGKDPIAKYTTPRLAEFTKNSNFQYSTTSNEGSSSSRRGVSRAMSEELKRKMPYRQRLLGCLGLSSPMIQSLSRGLRPTDQP